MFITFHRFHIYLFVFFFHEQNLQLFCIILTIKYIFFNSVRYSLFISRRRALESCRTSSALILPYGLLKSLQLFMFPIWKIDIIFSYLDYRSPLNSLVSYQCATVCSRLPPTSSFSLAITPNFYGCNWQWNSHLFQTMLNFIWQLIAPHSYGPQKKNGAGQTWNAVSVQINEN